MRITEIKVRLCTLQKIQLYFGSRSGLAILKKCRYSQVLYKEVYKSLVVKQLVLENIPHEDLADLSKEDLLHRLQCECVPYIVFDIDGREGFCFCSYWK